MTRAVLLLALTGLCACAPHYASSVRLALDGPPLAVVMRDDATRWSGSMDRSCMAGVGAMTLTKADGVTCKGEMDRPATDKGRLYMDLACDNGDSIALVFRNLGPDQGMGLGRVNPQHEEGEKTTLFYHPSQQEAVRRLEEVRAEITAALDEKRKKTEELEARMAD